MRKFIVSILIVGAAVLAAGFVLTRPERVVPAQIDASAPDLANGRLVFFAGGCASCHATPGQPDKLQLGGGLRLDSPFGTFSAPNISPDPEKGIGAWSLEAFATAVLKGVSPEGRHYYPAFPYTAYQHMTPPDVRDLFAYIKTLAPVAKESESHDFIFELPFARRAVGLWKRLNLGPAALPPAQGQSAQWVRGRYLVEALSHCAECHSPRNLTGGIDAARRMAGGVMADGDAAPNLTPGKGGIGDWEEDDIAFFLADGTTPEGDVVGGDMARVIANTEQLPEEDRTAMAVYLKSLAPLARE